jgi:hypothetical protein
VPVVAGLIVVAGVTACSTSPGTSNSAADSPSGVSQSPSAQPAASVSPATDNASTPPPTKNAPRKDVIHGLIKFNGHLNLSGAQTSVMSFQAFPGVTSPKSSCAHIGRHGTPKSGGRQLYRIPAPPLGGNVSFTAEIMPYHGPGTYHKSSVVAVGASVIVGSSSYNLLAPGASIQVTFRRNGSGTLTFANAAAAGSSTSTLSGTVAWTCSA